MHKTITLECQSVEAYLNSICSNPKGFCKNQLLLLCFITELQYVAIHHGFTTVADHIGDTTPMCIELRIRPVVDAPPPWLLTYKCLIKSHLHYCSLVWFHSGVGNFNKKDLLIKKKIIAICRWWGASAILNPSVKLS